MSEKREIEKFEKRLFEDIAAAAEELETSESMLNRFRDAISAKIAWQLNSIFEKKEGELEKPLNYFDNPQVQSHLHYMIHADEAFGTVDQDEIISGVRTYLNGDFDEISESSELDELFDEFCENFCKITGLEERKAVVEYIRNHGIRPLWRISPYTIAGQIKRDYRKYCEGKYDQVGPMSFCLEGIDRTDFIGEDGDEAFQFAIENAGEAICFLKTKHADLIENIEIYSKLKNVETIWINGLNIEYGSEITELVRFLGAFPKLKRLTIELKKAEPDGKEFYLEEIDMRDLTNLEFLKLSANGGSVEQDIGFVPPHKIKKIDWRLGVRKLNIYAAGLDSLTTVETFNVRNLAFENLGESSQLKSLELNDCEFPPQGIGEAKKLEYLRILPIAGDEINGDSTIRFVEEAALPENLKKLYISIDSRIHKGRDIIIPRLGSIEDLSLLNPGEVTVSNQLEVNIRKLDLAVTYANAVEILQADYLAELEELHLDLYPDEDMEESKIELLSDLYSFRKLKKFGLYGHQFSNATIHLDLNKVPQIGSLEVTGFEKMETSGVPKSEFECVFLPKSS